MSKEYKKCASLPGLNLEIPFYVFNKDMILATDQRFVFAQYLQDIDNFRFKQYNPSLGG